MARIITQNEAAIQPGLNFRCHIMFHKLRSTSGWQGESPRSLTAEGCITLRHYMHVPRESRNSIERNLQPELWFGRYPAIRSCLPGPGCRSLQCCPTADRISDPMTSCLLRIIGWRDLAD